MSIKVARWSGPRSWFFAATQLQGWEGAKWGLTLGNTVLVAGTESIDPIENAIRKLWGMPPL